MPILTPLSSRWTVPLNLSAEVKRTYVSSRSEEKGEAEESAKERSEEEENEEDKSEEKESEEKESEEEESEDKKSEENESKEVGSGMKRSSRIYLDSRYRLVFFMWHCSLCTYIYLHNLNIMPSC